MGDTQTHPTCVCVSGYAIIQYAMSLKKTENGYSCENAKKKNNDDDDEDDEDVDDEDDDKNNDDVDNDDDNNYV